MKSLKNNIKKLITLCLVATVLATSTGNPVNNISNPSDNVFEFPPTDLRF